MVLNLAVTESTAALAAQLPHRPVVWPPLGVNDELDGDRETAPHKPMRYVKFRASAFELEQDAPSDPDEARVVNQQHRRTELRDETPDALDEESDLGDDDLELEGSEFESLEDKSDEWSLLTAEEDGVPGRERASSPKKSAIAQTA